MQDKTKNIIITIGFISIIFFLLFVNIITEDKVISVSERRKLAQFPEFTTEKVISREAIEKWEKYAEDQFAQRDMFREIKSFWSLNIFAQKDNNKLFIKDNAIYKMEYPLKENNVLKSVQKINEVYEKYLKNMNVYYSIIPDKNYYLEDDDHLKIDFNKVEQIIQEELTEEMKYIDIMDSLKLEDYYRTDLHWKQENLGKVVSTIQTSMNIMPIKVTYKVVNKGAFYGAYYGQLPTNAPADTLYVLTNDTIENSITYNYETKKNAPIYTETNSSDRYDIFVSGATPLISIENLNANTNKELLLFRDSFGSSLAPLLVENYSKITLIDLRYISSRILDQFIEFENQDVLFLYSTVVLNQNILK